MKRFWTTVDVIERDGGFGLTLDDRRVRTPARSELLVPNRSLAEAIALEWRQCGETIDPRTMPLTGLANAAVDHVVPAPDRFVAPLAAYAAGDLLCYRAEHPPGLVAAQADAWDPTLAWASSRFDISPRVVTGVMHVDQPPGTVERLQEALKAANAFQLAALSPIVTIGGSLITALALLGGARSADEAWDIVSVDDRWQIDQWGRDAEAVAALEGRRDAFFAAARFLDLLG